MPCLVQNYSYTPCPRLSEKLGEIAETLGVFWVKYGIKRAQLHRDSIIGHEIKMPKKQPGFQWKVRDCWVLFVAKREYFARA